MKKLYPTKRNLKTNKGMTDIKLKTFEDKTIIRFVTAGEAYKTHDVDRW